jgi:predicted phage tail protein
MIRTIVLTETLAKAAGARELRLNVDNPQQLLGALRCYNTPLNMALRQQEVGLVASDEDDTNLRGLRDGFQFGNANTRIHVVTPTDGAWWFVIIAVVMMVVSYAVTRLTMSSMQTNANGPGGPKSTMFNGPVNSTDQGGAIPKVFGKKFLVGTEVIASDESYTNILS